MHILYLRVFSCVDKASLESTNAVTLSTGSSASHGAGTSQLLCLGSDSAEEMSGMRPLVSPFQLLWPGSYTGPGMDAPVRQVLSASSHGSEEDFTALVACVVAAQLQLDRHFLLLAVMTLNGSGGSAGRQHRPTLAPSHHPAKEAGNHRKQVRTAIFCSFPCSDALHTPVLSTGLRYLQLLCHSFIAWLPSCFFAY
jgi:hypothetical protein